MTVPPDVNWVLVGEWDLPNPDGYDKRTRYTRSIIEMDGKHYRVNDGTFLAGCCFWPVVYKLDKQSASTFWDAADESTYVINEDGTLSIFAKNGKILKISRTPREEMRSNKWQ